MVKRILAYSLLATLAITVFIAVKMVINISELSRTLPDRAYSIVSPVVYQIRIKSTNPDAKFPYYWGTAFRVRLNDNKTYIVTNAHLCEHNDYNGVEVLDRTKKADTYDQQFVGTKVIKYDEYKDLCLLADIPNQKSEPLKISPEEPYAGDPVVTGGYPASSFLVAQTGHVGGINKEETMPISLRRQMRLFQDPNQPPEEKMSMCPPGYDFQANIIIVPIFGPQMVFTCITLKEFTFYSFRAAGGSSGSPVLNGNTNELIGVISITKGEPMQYGGGPTYKEMKDFLTIK